MERTFVSGSKFPHTKFFTRFVACPGPSSLGLYQPKVGSSPDPYSLSEQSSLAAPTDPQERQALVEPVSAATQLTRSLVLETACGVHLPPYRSRGTALMLVVSATGMCFDLVPLEVGLSAVVVFVGTAVFVVEIAVAAAVGLGSGEIGGLNHSAMM